MKKICIVTSARSEYGLLKRIMAEIQNDPDLELQLIAWSIRVCTIGMTTYILKL